MKDHETREAINELRDIAIKYHGAQQLRERIAGVVLRITNSYKPKEPMVQSRFKEGEALKDS